MRFSIIIPVYNVEKYIRRCMESVMEQSFADYEVIVVDDESPDNSMGIVEEFAAAYPGKITMVHQKNTRQGGARNHGVKLAQGEYLLFVDSDDYVSRDLLKTVDARLREMPCDILNFRHTTVTEEGAPMGKGGYDDLAPGVYSPQTHPQLAAMPCAPWHNAYRRSFYVNSGFQFPEKILYEDTAVRLLYIKAATIGICEDSLYCYVQSGNSSIRQKVSRKMLDILTVTDLVLNRAKEDGLYEPFREWLDASLLISMLYISDYISYCEPDSELLSVIGDYILDRFPAYAANPHLSGTLKGSIGCLVNHDLGRYHSRYVLPGRKKEQLMEFGPVAALRSMAKKAAALAGSISEDGLLSTGKKCVNRMFANAPLKKIIIFESSPDYACNTYPAYLQLRQLLPDYKMVWWTSRNSPKPDGVDDAYFYDGKTLWDKVKAWYYPHFARAFVTSNRVLEVKRPEQLFLFLCHGSKTKKTRGSYELREIADYINVQSHFFDEIITYEYNCPKSKLVYLGYPRCDAFFRETGCAGEKMGLRPESKYVVWLPTFRKHANKHADKNMDASKYGSIGMPLVYSLEELKRLDAFLAVRNLYIFFKPHPMQDVSGLVCANLEHVRIIRDKDLSDRGLVLYDLLADSEGLITDYSSVFFDYLLSDKPMATTTDDIDEWKQATGFAFDLDAFLEKATVRTSTLDGLLQFLNDLHNGIDTRADGRKEIRELTNIYFDGDSAKRVAEFLAEKLGG